MAHQLSRTIRVTMVLISLFGISKAGFTTETYVIDPVHSAVVFRILHLNIAPAYGMFSGISGKVLFDPDQIENSSIEVVIDTRTVNTLNEKRDEHLRSPDFFNVEQFPEARFRSDSWRKIDERKFRISGKLTILGVEKSIEFDAHLVGKGKGRNNEDRIGFEAVIPIKRSEFGMTKFLPNQLSDEVQITVGIEAVKQE